MILINFLDPWLVKNKRICPQCRKRVFDRGSGYSGESDSDDNQTNNERAPLIRPSTSRSTGGNVTSLYKIVEILKILLNNKNP